MKRNNYFISILKIIYQNSPMRFLICIGMLIFIATFPLLNLITTNMLIDCLTTSPLNVDSMVLPIIAFIVSLLLNNAKAFINLLGSYIWITAEMALQSAMVKKATAKSLIYFDTPAFYNNLQKAKEGYQNAIGTAMMFISAIFISLISIVFMAGYLCQIDERVVMALVLIVMLKSISYKFETHSIQTLREKQIDKIKKRDLLATYFWTKETRSYGASKYFWKQWKVLNEQLSKEKSSTECKNLWITLGLDSLSYVCYAVILVLAVLDLLQSEHTMRSVSDVVVLFVAMESIFLNINTVVIQFGSLLKNATLSKDLFDFLSSEEIVIRSKEFQSNSAIELKDVSFCYFASEKCALKNINLTVYPGENIAIVGKNGSGKTTLVKILCGLYEPTSGKILYGDSLYLLEKSHKNIASMFQNVNTYCISLVENVCISEIEKKDNQKAEAILMKIFGENWLENYPEGGKTKIGRAFGGIDLSGGEKQKLSLSRTLFRTSTLLFFDEPTAAIDPLAEDRLYQDILKMSQGKTTFFITHRLATVRYADRIIVLDNGEIVEEGTFKTLIQEDGVFANMYLLQKEGLE